MKLRSLLASLALGLPFLAGCVTSPSPLPAAPLPAAGAIGSLLGSETVQHLGAAIPDAHWPRIRAAAAKLTAG